MKLTRESAVWWFGVVSAILCGLATLDADTAAKVAIPLAALPYLRLYSLVVGLGSAWAKTSPFPSKHDAPSAGSVDLAKIAPLALLVLALGAASFSVTGCAKANPNLSPSGKTAFTADQIVQRLYKLQNAVIASNQLTPGSVPDAVAVPIVRFCVESAKVLKASPNGVLPALAAEWRSVKVQIPAQYRQLPAVAGAFVAVDIVFAEYGQ